MEALAGETGKVQRVGMKKAHNRGGGGIGRTYEFLAGYNLPEINVIQGLKQMC